MPGLSPLSRVPVLQLIPQLDGLLPFRGLHDPDSFQYLILEEFACAGWIASLHLPGVLFNPPIGVVLYSASLVPGMTCDVVHVMSYFRVFCIRMSLSIL